MALTLSLAAGLVGCGRQTVAIDNPTRIIAPEYDRIFDASVQVLRDMRFVVDRKDRRFGVVTTRPMIAASAFEPWHPDNTTSDQVAQSTLNYQRRSVRITIEPTDQEAPFDDYMLDVAVLQERRQVPHRQLTSSAVADVSYRGRAAEAQAVETEVGRETAFWRPVGRDAELERRILADILRLSVKLAAGESPGEAEPEADIGLVDQ